MATLTQDQRKLRNALIGEAAARNPGHYLDAVTEGVRRYKEIMRGNAAPAAASARRVGHASETQRRTAKAVRKAARIEAAVRDALTAAQAPQPPPGTGQAPISGSASRTAAPAKPLHELSADELTDALAATYRDVSAKSPFWAQGARETAPAAPVREAAPGYPQRPASAILPPIGVSAIPAPDPVKPLHQMDFEEMFQACADWFTAQSRQGHQSPFWQVA